MILTSGGVYSTGITALTNITGVCVDSSDNIYVHHQGGGNARLSQYSSALVEQWIKSVGTSGGQAHITTDGAHVWVCNTSDRQVRKRLCSDGSAVSTFGSSGSTDGKFGSGGPYGITNDGTHLYVTDPGNSRVQKFLVSTGAYVTEWANASPRGIAADASGDVVVGGTATGAVRRSTNVGVFIDEFVLLGLGDGLAVASGDVVWAGNSIDATIAKWDEAVSAGGYGQVAIDIGGSLGTYTGIGLREGAVANAPPAPPRDRPRWRSRSTARPRPTR